MYVCTYDIFKKYFKNFLSMKHISLIVGHMDFLQTNALSEDQEKVQIKQDV